MEELANKLVDWIREQVLSAGCGGVTIGLSGGIDSSVVAVLCKRAFPNNTLALILPCHSSERDIEDANSVATRFLIPTRLIPLDDVFDSLVEIFPKFRDDPGKGVIAEANLKVRLRMVTLYYIANHLGYLVVGTGNRSELAVGYFTKYGDGGVDIIPLGNLVKSQVRELAYYLGIPKELIQKPPSAGLWTGQTDEGEMGITYEELDRYIITGQAGEELKKRIEELSEGSAHKRLTPPIPSL